MAHFPELRIFWNPTYDVYEVYDTYDGTIWYEGTYEECLIFVTDIHGDF